MYVYIASICDVPLSYFLSLLSVSLSFALSLLPYSLFFSYSYLHYLFTPSFLTLYLYPFYLLLIPCLYHYSLSPLLIPSLSFYSLSPLFIPSLSLHSLYLPFSCPTSLSQLVHEDRVLSRLQSETLAKSILNDEFRLLHLVRDPRALLVSRLELKDLVIKPVDGESKKEFMVKKKNQRERDV